MNETRVRRAQGAAIIADGEAAAGKPNPAGVAGKPNLLRVLGPGLVTGASDDDPSGIGTYSQAGAQLGFGISWTMLLTYPLMVAIQEISARVGRVTGRGIAGNLGRHYSPWMLQGIVVLLFAANAINLGADLGAMADAARLLVGGPQTIFVIGFGVFCIVSQVFIQYRKYVQLLKWLTLSLFSYVAAMVVVRVPWSQALKGLLLPTIAWNGNYLTTLVALAGTTISPYLFFWQASLEAEDVRVKAERAPLIRAWRQAPAAFSRIRADTAVGMACSNVIAVSIMTTTAATLHAKGVTDIATSAQAAKALQPIAGDFASLLFAMGIIGTGLLAVPVLAGSAAYALAESRRWPVGLARQPKEAAAFYVSLAVATAIGVGLNLTMINPIKALYWSAVTNGVIAVPVMIILMLTACQRRIMGDFAIGGWLRAWGWLATAFMALCAVGMFATAIA